MSFLLASTALFSMQLQKRYNIEFNLRDRVEFKEIRRGRYLLVKVKQEAVEARLELFENTGDNRGKSIFSLTNAIDYKLSNDERYLFVVFKDRSAKLFDLDKDGALKEKAIWSFERDVALKNFMAGSTYDFLSNGRCFCVRIEDKLFLLNLKDMRYEFFIPNVRTFTLSSDSKYLFVKFSNCSGMCVDLEFEATEKLRDAAIGKLKKKIKDVDDHQSRSKLSIFSPLFKLDNLSDGAHDFHFTKNSKYGIGYFQDGSSCLVNLSKCQRCPDSLDYYGVVFFPYGYNNSWLSILLSPSNWVDSESIIELSKSVTISECPSSEKGKDYCYFVDCNARLHLFDISKNEPKELFNDFMIFDRYMFQVEISPDGNHVWLENFWRDGNSYKGALFDIRDKAKISVKDRKVFGVKKIRQKNILQKSFISNRCLWVCFYKKQSIIDLRAKGDRFRDKVILKLSGKAKCIPTKDGRYILESNLPSVKVFDLLDSNKKVFDMTHKCLKKAEFVGNRFLALQFCKEKKVSSFIFDLETKSKRPIEVFEGAFSKLKYDDRTKCLFANVSRNGKRTISKCKVIKLFNDNLLKMSKRKKFVDVLVNAKE